jgi:hypothetical protein
MKKIIAAALTAISLISICGTANAGVLEQLLDNKLIASLVPTELKAAVKLISSDNALGVNSGSASTYRPADETDNIDESQWKELEKSALKATSDAAIKGTGITLGTVNSTMLNTALGSIDAVNNNKIRQQVKQIQEDRSTSLTAIETNSTDSESTLDAANKLAKIEGLKAKNQMVDLDLRSRELTASQVRNTNDLRLQQDKLADKKNEEIGLAAQRIKIAKLTKALMNPSYETSTK